MTRDEKENSSMKELLSETRRYQYFFYEYKGRRGMCNRVEESALFPDFLCLKRDFLYDIEIESRLCRYQKKIESDFRHVFELRLNNGEACLLTGITDELEQGMERIPFAYKRKLSILDFVDNRILNRQSSFRKGEEIYVIVDMDKPILQKKQKNDIMFLMNRIGGRKADADECRTFCFILNLNMPYGFEVGLYGLESERVLSRYAIIDEGQMEYEDKLQLLYSFGKFL